MQANIAVLILSAGSRLSPPFLLPSNIHRNLPLSFHNSAKETFCDCRTMLMNQKKRSGREREAGMNVQRDGNHHQPGSPNTLGNGDAEGDASSDALGAARIAVGCRPWALYQAG